MSASRRKEPPHSAAPQREGDKNPFMPDVDAMLKRHDEFVAAMAKREKEASRRWAERQAKK
jgi:hypothetical protein